MSLLSVHFLYYYFNSYSLSLLLSGTFVTSNLKSLEAKLKDPILTAEIKDLIRLLNDVVEEIDRYEGIIIHIIIKTIYISLP